MRILSGALIASCAFAHAAHAQYVTFGFTDLDGSFDGTNFTAVSVDSALLQSSGDVSLVGLTGGTADYDAGFMSLGTSALAEFEMLVSNNNGKTADGNGRFDIYDADGDWFHARFAGVWTDRGNGFAYFDGSLNVAWFDELGDLDGMFNGPSGGAFSMADLTGQTWRGGAISFLMPIPNGFFTNEFDANVTLVDGIVTVPAPGAVGVLALGGIAAIRRRR